MHPLINEPAAAHTMKVDGAVSAFVTASASEWRLRSSEGSCVHALALVTAEWPRVMRFDVPIGTSNRTHRTDVAANSGRHHRSRTRFPRNRNNASARRPVAPGAYSGLFVPMNSHGSLNFFASSAASARTPWTSVA